MRHFKIMGLCLVAVFALAAVAASSASATGPEWGRCLAQKHGNYTEGNCQTVATKHGVPDHKGSYEWYGGAAALCYPKKHGEYVDSGCTTVATKHGVPDHKGHYEKTAGNKFVGVAGAALLHSIITECYEENNEPVLAPRTACTGAPIFREPPGYVTDPSPRIECTSQIATGEAVSGNEVANVSVRFKGCTLGGNPATSTNSCSPACSAGEIQVLPLKGKIGYTEPHHEVGVLLEPVTAGGNFAEFVALGVGAVVGAGNATTGSFYEAFNDTTPGTPNGNDGVVSPITPINVMTHEFTQNYRISEVTKNCKTEISEKNCGGARRRKIPGVPERT